LNAKVGDSKRLFKIDQSDEFAPQSLNSAGSLDIVSQKKGEYTNVSEEEDDDVENLLDMSANGKRRSIKRRDGEYGDSEEEENSFQISEDGGKNQEAEAANV
jgi:hypothetical protein